MESAAQRSSEEEEEEADALTSWLRLTRAASTLLDRKRSAETYWAKRARPDGRLLLQCRPTSVETGVVEPSFQSLATSDPSSSPPPVSGSAAVAAGSSLVRLGGTHVLAVVTLQVGCGVAPVGASGHESASGSGREGGGPLGGGDVVITCSHRNFIGSSSSSSSSVDPTLTSYLQRVVEENADLGQLYLPLKQQHEQKGALTASVPPPQAFRLCVGVEVLADGGNVRDAALLACTAALADTCLPSAELDPNSDVDGSTPRVRLVLDAPEEPRRMSCPRLPVPLTVGVWEGGLGSDDGRYQLIVDPTKEEQAALSGSITVVVDAIAAAAAAADAAPNDEEACVLSCEMKGRTDLTTLALAVTLARGRAKELLPVLRP